jgi:hypothetical protein
MTLFPAKSKNLSEATRAECGRIEARGGPASRLENGPKTNVGSVSETRHCGTDPKLVLGPFSSLEEAKEAAGAAQEIPKE